MEIYLPIAEVSQNIIFLLFIGLSAGFLSGMFGVGGGILTTPILILIGIPPPVAVGSEANHIVGASISGFMTHYRRNNVDIKMGFILLIGGVVGSIVGVILFRILSEIGQIEEFISFTYIIFLGSIGMLMFAESIRTRRRKASGGLIKLHEHSWIHGLPFRVRFRRSKLYISIIPPILVSFVVGILAAIMGVGGGFILVPAMIYILGMPTQVVIGTSLMQIVFVTASATILHASVNHTVDIVLSIILLIGAVIGVQIGSRMVQRISGEVIRLLLAMIILAIVLFLLLELIQFPENLYTIEYLG